MPDIVTVLFPRANVEPAPEVSHCPLTVQDPLVRVSVPEAPPVNMTSTTATLAALAVRIPELPTARDPPVKVRFDVASVVVDPAETWIRRRPLPGTPYAASELPTVPPTVADSDVVAWN